MDIVLTHTALDRIINDTDKVIEEHKLYGCPVIGLGCLPGEYRERKAAVEDFIKMLREPVRKIEAAGLRFGYHNHNFEFEPFTDADDFAMEVFLKECPTWDFTLDLYWVEYANQSAIEWLSRVGGERLDNVHLKDMSKEEDRAICACGNGRFDLKGICEACEKVGVKNLLVEQDNAVDFEDPFGQMEISFKALRPFIKKMN